MNKVYLPFELLMHIQEKYMHRCLQLAMKGSGLVAPNPMVGAVLVYLNRIIGEGWHQQYGGPHAEVNCINSVAEKDKHLIEESCLYVSLEPCSHFGKTPPCTNLIIESKIPQVVIGCRDVFAAVNGKGIDKLQNAGVVVTEGVLEKDCKKINSRFFTYHQLNRPYVILKWAQTSDGFIGNGTNHRLLISNEYSNKIVHQWRSQEAAILVGTNTALFDNPTLTVRYWPGPSPIRVVLDLNGRLHQNLNLLDGSLPTIVITAEKDGNVGRIIYKKIDKAGNVPLQICNLLYDLNIQSIIVEGGARLLQSFIDADLWDEAKIITNEALNIGNGVEAPVLTIGDLISTKKVLNDKISIYSHHKNDYL